MSCVLCDRSYNAGFVRDVSVGSSTPFFVSAYATMLLFGVTGRMPPRMRQKQSLECWLEDISLILVRRLNRVGTR